MDPYDNFLETESFQKNFQPFFWRIKKQDSDCQIPKKGSIIEKACFLNKYVITHSSVAPWFPSMYLIEKLWFISIWSVVFMPRILRKPYEIILG